MEYNDQSCFIALGEAYKFYIAFERLEFKVDAAARETFTRDGRMNKERIKFIVFNNAVVTERQLH
jgi:hypothetical protein